MPKQLKSVSEVAKHFDYVKETKNVAICFNTALRTVDGQDKKQNIPYPVLYPAPNATISDYFADVEKLGYDAKDILKTGFALYFNKKFVPVCSVLTPSRSPKSKTPPADFRNKIAAELAKNPTKLAEMIINGQFDPFVEKEWAKTPTGAVGEYVCVSSEIAEELAINTKAALAEFTITE